MPWMVEVANLRKGFGDPPRSISLKRIFRILLLWQLCPKFAAVALWVGATIIGCLDLPLRNKGAIWLALVQAMRGKVQSFSKQPTQLQWSFHTWLYLNTWCPRLPTSISLDWDRIEKMVAQRILQPWRRASTHRREESQDWGEGEAWCSKCKIIHYGQVPKRMSATFNPDRAKNLENILNEIREATLIPTY